MISCEFKTAREAIEYAKKHGGWLYYRIEDGRTFWYDAAHYTMSKVLWSQKGSGYVGMVSDVEQRINELEGQLL